MDTVVIVCGAGASSTFLASRIRALATTRGLDLTARAVSEPDLAGILPIASVLLVGPHLVARFDEISLNAGVPAALLPDDVFGPTGAETALDLATTMLRASAAAETESTLHG